MEKIETVLKEKYSPDLSVLTRESYGFKLKDGSVVFVAAVPFQFNSKYARKVIKSRQLIYAEYCPFCGKKYGPKEKAHHS
jgi:hypothetical protein